MLSRLLVFFLFLSCAATVARGQAQRPPPYIDTNTSLTANLDTRVASQKATKTYADTKAPLSGTAASLTAGHVTTNANLTGPITSVGNATSIASQTGTGTKFVMDTAPTVTNLSIGAGSAITSSGAGGALGTAAFTAATAYQAAGSYAASGANSDITGLSGSVQATQAQAIAGTSTTTVVSPSVSALGAFGYNWHDFALSEIGSANVGGTGSTSSGTNSVDVSSGATASSWGNRTTSFAGLAPETAGTGNTLNFDKTCGFVICFRGINGTTNGFSRFAVGPNATNGSGNTGKLNGKGIGLEVRNYALYSAVHDGSTLSNTSLSYTLNTSGNETVTVLCVRSASGSFDYYVNGVKQITQTSGPTGAGTSNNVSCAVDNNGDAATQRMIVRALKIFQGL